MLNTFFRHNLQDQLPTEGIGFNVIMAERSDAQRETSDGTQTNSTAPNASSGNDTVITRLRDMARNGVADKVQFHHAMIDELKALRE